MPKTRLWCFQIATILVLFVVAEHEGEGIFFRREAELTLFLGMRTKEIVKTWRTYIATEELFPCYTKWGSSTRTARSDFWPEARK